MGVCIVMPFFYASDCGKGISVHMQNGGTYEGENI